MGANDRFNTNRPKILEGLDNIKNINIGVVSSVDDPFSLGRIQVKIPGVANVGGDFDTAPEELAWCFPMIPKFMMATPKVGEGVFVMSFSNQRLHSDRLYLGPIISE